MKKCWFPITALFVSVVCHSQEVRLKPGDTFKDCELCPEMVILPTGKGWLGMHPDENPPFDNWREGRFDTPLSMGKYEVLQRQYLACVEAGKCQRPEDMTFGHYPDAPVFGVSWNDAQSYVEWLAETTKRPYRLPSRNEWEYAARGGTSSVYWWGDEFEVGMDICDGCGDVAAGEARGYARPQGVTNSKIPSNPFGLFYMLGNVGEWVVDCFDKSSTFSTRDTAAPSLRQAPGECEKHLFQGGHYRSKPQSIKPWRNLGGLKPSYSGDLFTAVGFRVAMSYAKPNTTPE